MPLFGSHLSIGGGFHKAVEAAGKLGFDTVQIFTGNPRQFPAAATAAASGKTAAKAKKAKESAASPLSDEEVRLFRSALEEFHIRVPCSHDSYLINLGSPDELLWKKSLEAYILELLRSEALGLRGVVMHPGSHLSSSVEEGLANIVRGLDEAHRRTEGIAVQTWLEVTAGQGTNLGYRFEHLGEIIRRSRHPERFGVCLDTCHLFAAGYGLKTRDDYDATMQELEDRIGIDRVKAFHLNDSQREQGSRVDRHEHIGEGHLGLEPFRFVLNDPRFADLPMYLETKKEKRDGEEMDTVNLRTLRSLLKNP